MSFLSSIEMDTALEHVLSMRVNRADTYIYSSNQLKSIVGTGITIRVSGLPIDIKNLAESGWNCRIVYNRFGGRTRIAFRGNDGRSIINFRIDRKYHPNLTLPIDLFRAIDADGVMTSNSRPIPAALTDEELLTQVQCNIKNRLKRRLHKKKSKNIIERAVAFASVA